MKWSFKCVPRCLWRLPTQLPLHVLDSDWSTKSEWRGLWISAIWYGLRVIMSIYQLPRYSHAFFIDSICNGHIFITIHELKPWVFFSFNDWLINPLEWLFGIESHAALDIYLGRDTIVHSFDRLYDWSLALCTKLHVSKCLFQGVEQPL